MDRNKIIPRHLLSEYYDKDVVYSIVSDATQELATPNSSGVTPYQVFFMIPEQSLSFVENLLDTNGYGGCYHISQFPNGLRVSLARNLVG